MLAPKINKYLSKRDSPLAGHAQDFIRAGKKYGIDPRLLVGITVIESSAGVHQKLKNNPFNWGVHQGRTYPTYGAAIMDVARGLRRNYLDKGLTTPQKIVSKYAPSSDGNDEANWARVVSIVMRDLGAKGANASMAAQPEAPGLQPVPTPVRPGVTPASMPVIPAAPEFSMDLFAKKIQQRLTSGIPMRGAALGRMLQNSYVTPPPPPPIETDNPPAPGKTGVPTPGTPDDPGDLAKGHVPRGRIIPNSFKVTHETSGLEGYPATDWFKPAGTLVGAPVTGKITRISGGAGSRGDGIYGWNVYITGDDGSKYFLTHFGSLAGLKEGMRIKRGTPMGRVGNYGNADHIHVGKKR